jgi:hypothetical protein
MDAQPSPYPEYKVQWSGVTSEYRVTIWEQPELSDVDPEHVGWGEITFDLVGVNDVHEAIRWAEQKLAANEGPYSSGTPVRDREYVLYVKLPDEDRFVQIAGWDPSRNPGAENLKRVEEHS